MRIANTLLIPYEGAQVQTTLKLEEIRERISAAIDRSLPRWLAYLTFDRNGKYFGRETSEGFWVVRALPWTNSYRPYLWNRDASKNIGDPRVDSVLWLRRSCATTGFDYGAVRFWLWTRPMAGDRFRLHRRLVRAYLRMVCIQDGEKASSELARRDP